MTAITRWLAALGASALLVLATGCTTGPAVRADFDRGANFEKYKTFGFASPLGTDRGGYQSIVSQHLVSATTRELESRGLKLDSAAPQLLVNFNGALNDKYRVSTTPTPTMSMGVGRGYYGYRGGMYSAWPAYVDQTTVTPYTEGTLNIDIVDAERKQLVWESVITDSVTQKDFDNVKATLDVAVAAAFAKYPIQPAAKPK